MKHLTLLSKLMLFTIFALSITNNSFASEVNLQAVMDRLEALESENKLLKESLEKLSGQMESQAQVETPPMVSPNKVSGDIVKSDAKLGYEILDPTTDINRKQLMILERRQDGTLADNTVQLQGAVTAIANYQESNEDSRFGYLMRHPTANNQVGGTVSEATIHSTQLGFTATYSDWVTANFEMLYDPEQSFGSGTNTALGRNQVQVRRAYVLLGNLNKRPVYGSLGKMAIPFGLTDTVNPFTASTVWHVFGGLANGATIGYKKDKLSMSYMAVQGGSQFRAASTPVEGTAVPSKLNNFAVDANYSFDLGVNKSLLVGASYLHGSNYCNEFPITHFSKCLDNNPARDVYARLKYDNLTLKAEYGETTGKWPGTFNEAFFPQFAAHEVESFDIGAKYRVEAMGKPLDLSLEFSRFVAGPKGAEWENQDQTVLGVASMVSPSIKLFFEFIHTDGYAPLNFLSGGVPDAMGTPQLDVPNSSGSAKSDVIMLGINAAF